jgi:hypothetical protein
LIAPLIHNVTRLQHSRASGGTSLGIIPHNSPSVPPFLSQGCSIYRITKLFCVLHPTFEHLHHVYFYGTPIPYHPRPRPHWISTLIVRLERGHVAMLHKIPVLMLVLQRSISRWHAYSCRFCHQRSFAGPCNYFIPRVRSQLARLPVVDRLQLHSKENATLD